MPILHSGMTPAEKVNLIDLVVLNLPDLNFTNVAFFSADNCKLSLF